MTIMIFKISVIFLGFKVLPALLRFVAYDIVFPSKFVDTPEFYLQTTGGVHRPQIKNTSLCISELIAGIS